MPQANQSRVIGASLSGKVAKALQTETGIQSSTIASLTYRLNKQMLQLSKNDVLVIDEAGMVDFANMACLLNHANKAQAKVILVGDPDQLKPIHKGEIFRGIAERSGYIELNNIRRQRQDGDRQASLELAKGNIEAGLMHYDKQGMVKFADTPCLAKELLIENWLASLKKGDMKEHMMLAFTRKAVSSLNEQARMKLKEQGLISELDYNYQSENQSQNKEIQLTHGERILFRQNDKSLGVRNGDLGTITQINTDGFSPTLDSGEQVTIPKEYKHLDYGYALTVHKAQGMTVDKASVLIDSQYWDRNLSFVAMTRHRDKLNLYADRENHPDLKALTTTLSRTSTKDNVIDWSLDFSIRKGFNPDKMLGRAIKSIAGIRNTIKHKWNYLVHFEAYLKAQKLETAFSQRQELRHAAREIAAYLDNKRALKQELTLFEQEARRKSIDKTKLPNFNDLYQKTLTRDKRAYELVDKYGASFEHMTTMRDETQSIYTDKARYDRYLSIKAVARLPSHQIADNSLMTNLAHVDLKKDYIHIAQLANEYNKKAKNLYDQIKGLRTIHQQKLVESCKKEYPLLDEFYQLTIERNKLTGFKAEQLDKHLTLKAKEIIKNKPLCQTLNHKLPQYLKTIRTTAKKQTQHREHER